MWMAMGAWFSRFRSQRTTKEQLEQIEYEIQSIEDYKWSKLRQQKNLMALIFYGSGLLYTVVAILFYFFFLPNSYNLYDKCIYSLPLIVLPAIAYLLQRSMQGYFRWVLENNEHRLTELRKEKRKILDKVMESETYKVAKELLEKYDPSSLKPEKTEMMSPPRPVSSPPVNLRFRGSPPQPNTPAARHFMNTSNPNLNTSSSGITPQNSGRPAAQQLQQSQQYLMNSHRASLPTQVHAPRLFRPILPSERSVVEKMVDFVVGDGPNNRYALICCYCHSHNGMALRDEFEYLCFRCCYCNAFNPSRKVRPTAPRIAPAPLIEGESEDRKDGNESEKLAETDENGESEKTAAIAESTRDESSEKPREDEDETCDETALERSAAPEESVNRCEEL